MGLNLLYYHKIQDTNTFVAMIIIKFLAFAIFFVASEAQFNGDGLIDVIPAPLTCEGKPTESATQLKCLDGALADRWDGCVERGSVRVQCPYPFIPCNDLKHSSPLARGELCKSNGEFKCGR